MTEELDQLVKNLKLLRILEIYDEQLRAADKDDSSYSDFRQAQEIAFYITGAGVVQPAISDGAAPTSSTPIGDLPAPSQKTTVTIGSTSAAIDFIGIPWGLVGVTQSTSRSRTVSRPALSL